MGTFKAKEFKMKELVGISSKNIEEHLKLYNGYVNNSNLIINKINEYKKDKDNNGYAISELRRRFAFEFGGMKNHEYYFSSLENGAKEINKDGELFSNIEKVFGSFDNWLNDFKSMAKTRGVGWAMLYYDKVNNLLINHWVDEQHIGQLVGLSPVVCLDMWEHAFVYDYATSEKGKYIEAFFANLDWSVIEGNFNKAK